MLFTSSPDWKRVITVITSQVHVFDVGAGSKSEEQQFTWYPRMPGNSTANPVEKQKLQGSHMDPTCFEGACCYTCRVEPLEMILEREGLDHVDLLKVIHSHFVSQETHLC